MSPLSAGERRPLAATGALVLAGIGAAMFAANLWLTWSTREVVLPAGFEPGHSPSLMLALVLFVGAGGLVATQRPANPVGWILLAIGLLWQLVGLAGAVRITVFANGGVAPWAAWVWDVLWLQGLVLVPVLFLVFPDGRLPSRRWRPAMWLLATAAVLLLLVVGLHPGRLWSTPVDNPIGVASFPAVFTVLDAAGSIAGFAGVLIAAAAPVVRFRRAGLVERYQLKWFLAASVVVIGAWIAVDLMSAFGVQSDLLFTARTFPMAALPVATAVAVIRYRLYEIDLVLNKALLYAGLVGVIGLVYLGTVVGIGALVGGRADAGVPLTVAATALAAIVFQPARERLQRLSNRAVYGQRSNPYEVLASFTQRMTDAYPAGQAPVAMAEAVGVGLRVARCEIWLRVGDELRVAGRWPEPLPAGASPALASPLRVEAAATGRSYPVHHDGKLLGVIAIATRDGHPLADSEDRLLRDLAAAAWLVLDNAQLVSELRASRRRLVTAQDTQRRRIERDLHDGAQQRLLELALTLQTAHLEAVERGATEVSTIAAAEMQLQSALAELRDLARGIHPAILTEQGLAAALESIAERAPLPVTVAAEGIGRFAGPVEVTAYFVAAEALANVIKHAGAATATLSLSTSASRLHLTVVDDGCGGATPSGPGLRGLADRVEAMHGRFRVVSPAGEGTRIEVELPCA